MADSASSGNSPGPHGPAFPAAPARRSFAVEAHAGRKIAAWPLGRLYAGPDGVRVRLPFPWFITRSAGKEAITSITVARTITGACCVRFEGSAQPLADVHVHLLVRAQRILDVLHHYGYTVTDRKTGQPVARWPKRSRTAGPPRSAP
jgi:hypothetical protein